MHKFHDCTQTSAQLARAQLSAFRPDANTEKRPCEPRSGSADNLES